MIDTMCIVFLVICSTAITCQGSIGEREKLDQPDNAQTYLRGSNYIRLMNAWVHVTFEPSLYSHWDIVTDLKQMQIYVYNYVRVFLTCPALNSGFGRSSPGVPLNYTKNVIDFLVRASNYEISVMLAAEWNPANYRLISCDSKCDRN